MSSSDEASVIRVIQQIVNAPNLQLWDDFLSNASEEAAKAPAPNFQTKHGKVLSNRSSKREKSMFFSTTGPREEPNVNLFAIQRLGS